MTTARLFPPAPFGGGGSSKSGSSSTRVATEDENTLRSRSVARVLLLIGEGERELVDGGKSIFLDNVPLVGADGAANFSGVTWEWRSGLPDQEPMAGFECAGTVRAVGVDVKTAEPIIRTVTDAEVDAVQITTRLPALTTQDTTNGDLHGGIVSIAIDIRPAGGVWTTVIEKTFDGKNTAPFDFNHPRIELPSVRPVDIRYRRITADSTTTAVQNTTHFLCYTEIVDGKFAYPDCALLALTFDAAQFGSSLPTVSVESRKVDIPIPTNYNPTTRTYAGIWDGSFTTGATDNPMWAAWDAATNPRYGLGLDAADGLVDKWTAYQIARWCDDAVPDGAGGTRPRFTFNGIFETQVDAYSFMQTLAAVFMGKVWWSAGGVSWFADMPRDPDIPVTRANVEGGRIKRSTTALKSRHTVALVTWNNPDNADKQEIAVQPLNAQIARRGRIPISFTRAGCRSRAEALAAGAWALETEDAEGDAVSYVAGPDHEAVVPGMVIALADPVRAAVRRGGRLRAVSDDLMTVTLDAPVTIVDGASSRLMVRLPDGTMDDAPVATGAGTTETLVLTRPLSTRPVVAAVWALTGTDVAPKPYRVMSVGDADENGRREVQAIEHDPTKWDRIVGGINAAPPSYTAADGRPAAPAGLRAVESVYWVNGLPHSRITVSWSPSARADIARYAATVVTPGGASQSWEPGLSCGFEIAPADEGVYVIRVCCVVFGGLASVPAETRITAAGKGTPPSKCANLRTKPLKGGVGLEWINPPESDVARIWILESTVNDLATATICGKIAGTTFQRWGLKGLEGRYFWVKAEDFGGNVGDVNSNVGTWGASELIDVADVGRSIIDAVKSELPTSIPVIGIAETLANLTSTAMADFKADLVAKNKLSSRVADVETTIQQAVDDTQALASQVTTVGSRFDEAMAVAQQRIEALTLATEASAKMVATLQAQIEKANAALATEAQVRATNDGASASLVTTATANFNGSLAAVTDQLKAYVDDGSAVATALREVQTTVGTNSTQVELLMETRNGILGKAVLGVDSNGRFTGMSVIGTPTSGSIVFKGDAFAIAIGDYSVVPFSVALVNGVPTVCMTDVMIGDGMIGGRSIQSLACTNVAAAIGEGVRSVSMLCQAGPVLVFTQFMHSISGKWEYAMTCDYRVVAAGWQTFTTSEEWARGMWVMGLFK